MTSVIAMSRPSRATRAAGRVAFVFGGFGGGGIERSMLALSKALLAQGLSVDLVVGGAEGELIGEVPEQATVIEAQPSALWRVRLAALAADRATLGLLMTHKLRPLKPLRRLRRLPALVRYLENARPDAVLAAEAHHNLMMIWARHLARVDCRIVLSEHIHASSHAPRFNPWAHHHLLPLLRRAYLKADAIVAVSDGLADDLATHGQIPRDWIARVYNPVVGSDLLLKAMQPLDHPWFATGAPPVIMGAGRLHPQKDFATLIRALAAIRSRRPVRLVILGAHTDAEYAVGLQDLATDLGVAQDVEMPGFAGNPFAFMSRAAVFVLSSRYEGLGNVLIEALACGTPVVSMDCPSGPAEVLDNGRFGPLVPVGDVAALARAIEHVLDHPPAAQSLRTRARLFTVERAVDHYLRLLFPTQESSGWQEVARRVGPVRRSAPRRAT
jgi:glycosyltransferase involved in cell wall biosynthesis